VIPRHQLAVAPRITLASLLRATLSEFGSSASSLNALASALAAEFAAPRCMLTDSGTSALVLGLRLMVPKNGIVGLPSYGCVDITSAVRFAGLRARLYDIDPTTLSPDLDSVRRLLGRGVHALLVAHYYGYPAHVPAVCALASDWGVPVLEDAAQAACGSLGGIRLGSLGQLSVLSFGRGKGLFGGRGGALLVRSPEMIQRLTSERWSLRPRVGYTELFSAAAQWLWGRPSLYAIPASVPALRLGEMVYKPAHEPTALSAGAATLAGTAMRNETPDHQARVRKAAVLQALVNDADQLAAIQPIEGALPGYLRFAVVDRSNSRMPANRLGVMRAYPRTLHEHAELAPQLVPGEPATPGATLLRKSLFTLPTHSFVRGSDFLALQDWMHQVVVEAQDSEAATSAIGGRDVLSEGWSHS
jgi:hypothetical protein